MMYNYPFFKFPHFRRYQNYYPMNYSNANLSVNSMNLYTSSPINALTKKANISENSYINKEKNINDDKEKHNKREGNSFKRTPSGFNFLNNFLHQEDRDGAEEYFDLFGLKLYNDDLLLIGLIFFLYKEDVKDQYLFFALILLLLS